MFRERRRSLGWGWGCSGGEGLALLNVRRLGQVVAFGPSKDERVCLKCKNAVNAVSEDTLCIGVYMYAVSGSVSARFSSHIGSLVHKQAVRKQASILLTHFFSQPWERVNPRVNPRIVTTHMKLYM